MKKYLALALLVSLANVQAAGTEENLDTTTVSSPLSTTETASELTPAVVEESLLLGSFHKLQRALEGEYPLTALFGALGGGGLTFAKGGSPKNAVQSAAVGALLAVGGMKVYKTTNPESTTGNAKGDKALRAAAGWALGAGAVHFNVDSIPGNMSRSLLRK